ncbi:MAG: hypothetical protein ACREQJ_05605, partial [Candidatus Binatia bacterium]
MEESVRGGGPGASLNGNRAIGEESETLGHHLGSSIRTGTFCSYVSLEIFSWRLVLHLRDDIEVVRDPSASVESSRDPANDDELEPGLS